MSLTAPKPELFELMAHQVLDYAIFLLDPSGVVLSWNRGAHAIKQYVEAEVVGKHFSIFYTPEDIARDWPAHELRRAASEGRFEDAGWRVKKDGSRFWANVVITALTDESGNLLAYSKITRDLTRKKLEEEELRRSEERFRLLVDGVEDYAIYMLDPDGMVTSWNSGARRIKGYESSEIIGQHVSRFYTAEDMMAGKASAELAVAREVGRAEEDGWRRRKDGTRFWARVVVTALHDTDGTLRGFAKVTQDLTLRRHSEALEASAANVDAFIAILAHEMRNPLAPIRNAVQMLQKNVTPEIQQKLYQILDRQSAHLIRIVDDLLDVSRITRGALSINRRPISVATIVARSLETAKPDIDAGNHVVTVDMGDRTLMVDADEVRITQALTNVIKNAARYTAPAGSIDIRAFGFEAEGRPMARIAVRDTGRGIDPAFLQSIFGMFVQGSDATNRPAAGLGVGLGLARALIELHHGKLTVTSEGVGKGSEFLFELPLVESDADGASADARTVPYEAVARCRIMVVDDNVDAAATIAMLLQKHGHDVATVNDGASALRMLEAFNPEIVFLDIGMPGMDGLELARRIRERTGPGNAPRLIALTGWGQAVDVVKTRAAGIDTHLVKPVEDRVLLTAVGRPIPQP